MLVYLDQNHASRIAKHRLGQEGHEPFGRVDEALRVSRPCVPPSPFHVLETRGGYLLPTLRSLFEAYSGGLWLRPWQEVVRRQARRATSGRGAPTEDAAGSGAPAREGDGCDAARRGTAGRDAPDRTDLLTREGGWERAATLDPLRTLLEEPLRGGFFARCSRVREEAARLLGLPEDAGASVPFLRLLARLVAFRSLDAGRLPRPSDLTDLIMAATVAPYVDVLATDRYVRESLLRVGHRRPVFSGRRDDVLRLAALLEAEAAGPSRLARRNRPPPS